MEKKCVHKFLMYFSVFLPGMIEATGCCGFNDNNVTCMLVRNSLFQIYIFQIIDNLGFLFKIILPMYTLKGRES